MDCTNVNTKSQSGHSSVRGWAGAEPGSPDGRSSSRHRARCLLAASPCPQKGWKAAGCAVNLCPGLAVSPQFLLPWFFPRQGCKFTVNGNWRWCYLEIEWDCFSICSLFPPEDKGWLGGGKDGGELPESSSAVIYGYCHGLEGWVRAGPQPAKVSLTHMSFLRAEMVLWLLHLYKTSCI